MKNSKELRTFKLVQDDFQPFETISANNNHIYFYDEITRENILKLRNLIEKINRNFDVMQDSLVNKIMNFILRRKPEYPQIILHIHSYGGCVDSSVNIYDFIITNRYAVITIAEGACCSGATVLLQAGHHRVMQKNTTLLIHQIRGWMSGTHNEIIDELENWNLKNESLVEIYSSRSYLEKEIIEEMLENEKDITSDEALEFGLVDEILGYDYIEDENTEEE